MSGIPPVAVCTTICIDVSICIDASRCPARRGLPAGGSKLITIMLSGLSGRGGRCLLTRRPAGGGKDRPGGHQQHARRFTMTDPEPLTPEDTTIVMIDYAVDFANLLRSHDLGTPINTSSDWPSGRYEAGVTGPRRRLSAQLGTWPAAASRQVNPGTSPGTANRSARTDHLAHLPASRLSLDPLPRPACPAGLPLVPPYSNPADTGCDAFRAKSPLWLRCARSVRQR